MKQALNSDEPARDVATAENLLKKHQDLGDDIAAHQDEYVKVIQIYLYIWEITKTVFSICIKTVLDDNSKE